MEEPFGYLILQSDAILHDPGALMDIIYVYNKHHPRARIECVMLLSRYKGTT